MQCALEACSYVNLYVKLLCQGGTSSTSLHTTCIELQGQTVTSQRQADGKQSQQQRLHNMREGDAGQFDEEWTYEAERSLPMYMRQNTAALPQASRASRQPAVGFRW